MPMSLTTPVLRRRSKDELQSELNLPGGIHRAENSPDVRIRYRGGGRPREQRGARRPCRRTEIRMIGGVEKLRPELNVQFLRDLGDLHHCEIEIEETRPCNRMPCHIAQRAGRLQNVACGIKPPVRITQHAIRITSGGAGIVRTISDYPS